jgi:adenylosuccinate synthase
LRELDLLGIEQDRIVVDPRAVLVIDNDIETERRELGGIGSTCTGTGSAQIRRMSRRPGVRLSGDSPAIKARCRLETVAPLLHELIDDGGHVIVEGTQGFGLSLLHGAA